MVAAAAETAVPVVESIILLPESAVVAAEYMKMNFLSDFVAGDNSGWTPKLGNNANVYHLKTADYRQHGGSAAAIVPGDQDKSC